VGGRGLDQFGLGYWEEAGCFKRGKGSAGSLKLVEFSKRLGTLSFLRRTLLAPWSQLFREMGFS
jgi:hypothetical protein